MSNNISHTTITKLWAVCLLAMTCCFLWGSAFPCIKIGYEMFDIDSGDTASQILFAGCRFTLAGIIAILIGSAIAKKFLVPSVSALPKIFIIAMFQTIIQYFFFYIGLAHTTGVKSSIVVASSTFLSILISALIFRQEKLTLGKIAGCVVGFAGVILINLNGFSLSGLDLSFALKGEGFIFFSAIAYALSSVFMKIFSQRENPVMLSGYQFVFGGPVMIVIGLIMGGELNRFSPSCLIILVYLAIISSVAYSLWGVLLKYNPVSRVAVFGFMTPIFGVVLSSLALSEGASFGLRGIIALFLVCLGIFAVNRRHV